METLGLILIASLVCEAIVQLVVQAEILEPLRVFLRRSKFNAKLISCGYCFSVWVAPWCAVAICPLAIPTSFCFLNFIIWTLVVHRLSNFIHDFADRYLRGIIDFTDADAMFGVNRDA